MNYNYIRLFRKWFSITFGVLIFILTSTIEGKSIDLSKFDHFTKSPRFAITSNDEEASKWINSNWINILPVIEEHIKNQAILRNHKINNDNDYHLKEIMIFVDNKNHSWNGNWAIILYGTVRNFESDFRYYLQFHYKNVTQSSASGIGFNFGSLPKLKKNEKNKSWYQSYFVNTSEFNFSKHESNLLSGVWSPGNNIKKNIFHEMFGLDESWRHETDNPVHLVILEDLTLRVVAPYSGVSSNYRAGKILGFTTQQYKDPFICLLKDDQLLENAQYENAIFLMLVSESNLILQQGDLRIEFTRSLKKPMINHWEKIDNLKNLSIGSFHAKLP